MAILEFLIERRKVGLFRKKKKKIQIFERNSVLTYFSVTKIHIRKLDLNTKKQFSSILEFSVLKKKKGVGGVCKFRKIQTFERNSALNFFIVRKFHMRRSDLNTKKQFSTFFECLILSGKVTKFWKIRIFKHNWKS